MNGRCWDKYPEAPGVAIRSMVFPLRFAAVGVIFYFSSTFCVGSRPISRNASFIHFRTVRFMLPTILSYSTVEIFRKTDFYCHQNSSSLWPSQNLKSGSGALEPLLARASSDRYCMSWRKFRIQVRALKPFYEL